MKYDLIIVGGGILGFSTAMQVLKQHPKLKVAVLEKEAHPAMHQTGHNSGVIHAGVYYKPGSLKAQFCFEGCHATKAFCKKGNIPYAIPGKLVVATNELEESRLGDLLERCKQNGLHASLLSGQEVKAKQPGIEAVAGIYVTDTGVVNWKTVTKCYQEIFEDHGGESFFNQEITEIHEGTETVMLKTRSGAVFESRYLVTCAGLFADTMVKLSGLNPDFKIIPFRGEYYRLATNYNNFFNHLIYPVPDPSLPFLGVHFTPQVAGFTTVGPNAVLALSREGYRWRDLNLKDCLNTFSYAPTWKLLAKQWRGVLHELSGSVSKTHYLKLVQQYFPKISKSDLSVYPAGVRAQALDQTGKLIDEFLFMESARILHTCNAPSPAATSSLPIGKYIVEKLTAKLN